LAGCENFVGEWEGFIFGAFVNLEPVHRSGVWYDVSGIHASRIHNPAAVLSALMARWGCESSAYEC